jgi:ABC-type antimicrobial peptide transport system permease subunit
VRGRDFDATDVAGRPPAILISASLARQFWPNEDPIGKHITLTFFPGAAREVVGVVGDVKVDGLAQSRPAATLYVPLGQITASKDQPWQSAPMTLVVHTALNPMNLDPGVTHAIHDVDREIPVRDVQTMDEVVANSLSGQRFNLLLLGAFAVVALVLAGIGIYSVLSHSVRRRVQEIGIRLALGASLSDVLRMIVLEGMRPTLLGLAIGTAAALGLAKVMSSLLYQVKLTDPATSSLLYQVKPTDPVTFLAVAVVLALVAFAASVIPAYRAAKVDPLVALRYE